MGEEKGMSDLGANKRDTKVGITDIAIDRVPFIRYREIPEEHYETLQLLAKEVLRISRNENEGNEIAIAYDLDSPQRLLDGDRYVAWA